jgi:hypothetical protein
MVDSNIRGKKILFFLFITIIMIYGIYQFFWNKDIEKEGMFFKGVVINSESTKGSALITVKYEFFSKTYESILPSDLGKGAIGRQYFIQFKPKDPKAIVFHSDKPVPDCLIDVEAPKEGWDKIPSCP